MILANGDEIKLTYNLAALVDIENEFEGLTDLGEILSDSKHALRDTVSLLRIGVNATIARENELNGENSPYYTNQKLASLLDVTQISELRELISDAFTRSMEQTFTADNETKNG